MEIYGGPCVTVTQFCFGLDLDDVGGLTSIIDISEGSVADERVILFSAISSSDNLSVRDTVRVSTECRSSTFRTPAKFISQWLNNTSNPLICDITISEA